MMRSHDTLATLDPPVSDRDHILGPPDAPLTLVEYADFECPFCGDAFGIVKAVRSRLGDQLRFVFRHFPVPQVHPHAQRAAEAAEAAAAQGKFWEMHDYLFTHQPSLEGPDLIRYAGSLGLDAERFAGELRDRAYAARVREDVTSGASSGVEGTPTFFVNGRRHQGRWDVRTLVAALAEVES
ncbi:MAG: formate-nitrite transporter family protein [Thermomicrobiales bacterium]|jgi:protein-disulfide isomerase|nr:formate-nitrite transporter family protein [Thermomicrobiales bacterium]